MNNPKLRQLLDDISRLKRTDFDPRVRALEDKIRAERAPEIAKLEAQAEALRAKRPEKKPRWPANIPAGVLDRCQQYWRGTTEYSTFRVHCWNDKLVCTGYPAGGYSDNGGWNPTRASFYFLSMTETEYGKPKRVGIDLEGRQSQNKLEQELKERSTWTNKQ